MGSTSSKVRTKAASTLLVAVVSACGGEPASLEDRLGAQPGFWFEARASRPDAETMRTLAESGYTSGYVPAREEFGAAIHVPEDVQDGLNLYSSGHAPEAYLTTLEGELLHRWALPYEEVEGAPPMEHSTQQAWRRVRLAGDGSLLAIYEGLALVRVDRNSSLQWFAPGAHHDLDIDPEGRVHVLTRKHSLQPRVHPVRPVLEDFVAVLDGGGRPLQEVSVYEALLDSPWASELLDAAPDGIAAREGDVLHTNSIQWLDGSQEELHPGFARGNVLVCFRDIDAVAAIDLGRRRVVWFARGDWRAPHDPTLLSDGGLLIFDNMGHQGYSRALEVSASRVNEVRWTFGGEPPESLFSVFCGAASRLANGNTLITESCNGRALEVTSSGAVVWSFLSPHRAGDSGELVAALFEVERIPRSEAAGWLALPGIQQDQR